VHSARIAVSKPTAHSSGHDGSGGNVKAQVVPHAEPEGGGQPTTSHPSSTIATADEAVVAVEFALVGLRHGRPDRYCATCDASDTHRGNTLG
jgi:hypothetical protein